jgi:SAM-dependent methyltransferase
MDLIQYEKTQLKMCSNSRIAGGIEPARMGKRLMRNIAEAAPFFLAYGNKLPILDVGCGDGWGMECFKSHGFVDMIGIELVQERVDIAKKYGFSVFKGVAEDTLKVLQEHALMNVKYNVFISHTLEHCFDQKKVIEDLKTIANIFWIIVPIEVTGSRNYAHKSAIRSLDQLALYFDSTWELLKRDERSNCEPEGLLAYVKK